MNCRALPRWVTWCGTPTATTRTKRVINPTPSSILDIGLSARLDA
jgi:hypothetical protein